MMIKCFRTTHGANTDGSPVRVKLEGEGISS